jgi:glycosyltransferase involved in cell wall biosynthesis
MEPIRHDYILLTAARNEEAYIEATIQSVVAQSVPPIRWIVVSDGSTDGTDDIVARYAGTHAYLRLIRLQSTGPRTFGAKANAISLAYSLCKDMAFDYVGNLDADVTFGPTYYEDVIARMESDPKIGIAGGLLYDNHSGTYVRQRTSVEWSVSGPVQLFRRECYSQIGGYKTVRSGVDAVAEVEARMHGWIVRAFPELTVYHHRLTGSHSRGVLSRHYYRGLHDYILGYHPIFMLATCARRVTVRPLILASLARFIGYLRGLLFKRPKEVGPKFVRFLQREQLRRLSGR